MQKPEPKPTSANNQICNNQEKIHKNLSDNINLWLTYFSLKTRQIAQKDLNEHVLGHL